MRRNRRPADGVPGLMRYGLHQELASDTSDSDYQVGKSSIESDSDNKHKKKKDESSEEERPKKKRKGKIKKRKRMRMVMGQALKSDDSADSDYEQPREEKSPWKRPRESRTKECVRNERLSKITHNSPPSDCTWSLFPTEILAKVFNLVLVSCDHGARSVLRCAVVCKHWNAVVNEPITWQHVDLAFLADRKEKFFLRFGERLSSARYVKISGWSNLTDNGVNLIANTCTLLRSLNLLQTSQKITAKSVLNVAKKCEHLKRVNFSSIRVPRGTACIIQFLEIRGATLTHINFSSNFTFGSSVFTAIIKSCPVLRSVDMSNTSVRKICFATFQQTCPLLEELYLSNLSLEPRSFVAEDLPGFPQLRSCSIGKINYPGWVTNNLLLGITKNAQKLFLLDVRGTTVLTDAAFQGLHTTQLERLYLGHCQLTSGVAAIISSKFSNTLWDLDLSNVTITDGFIDYVIRRLASKCTKLRHLNVSGTSVSNECVVEALCSLELQSLDLSSCRSIGRGYKRLHTGEKSLEALKTSFIPSS